MCVTLERISLRCEGGHNTVRSESRCALRLRYVDLLVSIEVAVEVYFCFTVFSCQIAVEVQYRQICTKCLRIKLNGFRPV
jgi:hypothetical protein